MTPEESAFIEAIRLNPDDNLPRLVYADWIEERGEAARAWFIRGQCESDGNGMAVERSWPPRTLVGPKWYWRDGKWRTRQESRPHVIAQSYRPWEDELHAYEVIKMPAWTRLATFMMASTERIRVMNSARFYIEYHRGMISEIRCSSHEWFTHQEEWRRHPISRVRLVRPNRSVLWTYTHIGNNRLRFWDDQYPEWDGVAAPDGEPQDLIKAIFKKHWPTVLVTT